MLGAGQPTPPTPEDLPVCGLRPVSGEQAASFAPQVSALGSVSHWHGSWPDFVSVG